MSDMTLLTLSAIFGVVGICAAGFALVLLLDQYSRPQKPRNPSDVATGAK